jgi:hypothetical protein
MSHDEHAATLGIPRSTYNNRYYQARAEFINSLPASFVAPSPARVWNDNLTIEGDVLVFSDVETPYHDAPFVDHCIHLAKCWEIGSIVLAGDFVHFANFSHWAGDFQPAAIKATQSDAIIEIIQALPESKRQAALETLENVGIITPEQGISTEMAAVRQTVQDITRSFEHIYYIMGNHEKRKLSKQDYSEDVQELLRFIGAGESWTASPYYWCNVISGGETWRVEHPNGAGPNTARDLAVQYGCHVAMGHSHRWAMQRDPSGRRWALQIGHAVDETRLQYVQQRSARRDAHALGALIIRKGYPFLLSADSPWELLESMN